ncbi:MAG: bifunctional [glutamine synthetase] adenylyltransferase/[glutamine synthetase]-adenylyl-L-tyrosine phosphorylase [Magnetospirillum sp.]|nr:bifunctional [glutamine synthetase] adenylyltransferase/[glutamine synthetase]-adenylyl-L-tyrosine phosphorylase [Magnetospirillum sp.]
MNFPSAKTLPRPGDAAARDRGMERWLEEAAEQADPGLARFMRDAAADPAAGALLGAAFGNSPWLTFCLLREPAFARRILGAGPDGAFAALIAELRTETADAADQPRVMESLRVAKRRTALLVALADMAGAWTLESVTEALTRFAETAVRVAVTYLLRRQAGKGELVLADPADPEKGSGVVVLGMGKLGAGELNYSSDIDLIVLYDHEKIDYRGRRSLPECMIALTKELVRILDERTADGYVFRTDLRLRPDPGATPVAVSLVAAEAYYEGFGQNWERAAMIKARQVAGDPDAGARFLAFLKPFIWRKSLDFAAIQDIHSIKRQINAYRGGHVVAVGGHNIKLGRGGIREIEFFAQTQQLIWGGREPAMRVPATVQALRALAGAGHIGETVAAELEAAYRYLRSLEHRLQMVDDKQTQTLPADPARLAGIAAFMGHADADEMARVLTGHLLAVEGHYARLFEHAPALGTHGNLVFTGGENDPETVRTLAEMGFANADAVSSTIRGWHHGRVRATRSTRARELLTELTPALLAALATTANPDEAFMRFDDFLGRLPMGVPLFSLFHANPSLLDLVAEIMGDAPLLADHLARHPIVLDGVLQAGFLAPVPSAPELALELDPILAEAGGDMQAVLDASRRWVNDRKFQAGVQILRGTLDPGRAGRAFSDIAEAVLDRLGRQVEAEFARAHGRIAGGEWCLLAMGKLGGREMTATSDLDLILIYDAPPGIEESDGPRPLALATWYARLTQRIITALTAKTGEGGLYAVDMRLRPSGNSGPIATSLDSFRRYQREAAWTWEHMALTRARAVAGDPALGRRVEAVVREVLTQPRDGARLLADIADMRERIAREHKAESRWQVKHRRGGLVDIEFVAQYLQLAHAHDHPDILSANTGTALDRAAAAGVLVPGDRDTLAEAWRLWSAVQSVLRQTIAGDFDERTAPGGLRALMARAAGLTDFRSLIDRMDDCATAASEVYRRLLGG